MTKVILHSFFETQCSLSVLLYASPTLLFQCKQINELNVCWNSVVRKNFGLKGMSQSKPLYTD